MREKTSGQRRYPMPGFASLNPAYKKTIKYNVLFEAGAVACADKRGIRCTKKTSGQRRYPMPGFAVLNPAYKKLFKYKYLFECGAVACADKRGMGCAKKHPANGDIRCRASRYSTQPTEKPIKYNGLLENNNCLEFFAQDSCYKKLFKYKYLFECGAVACADKRGMGCAKKHPANGDIRCRASLRSTQPTENPIKYNELLKKTLTAGIRI